MDCNFYYVKAAQWGLQIPAVTGTKAHSIVLRPNAPVTAHALFMEYETAEGRVIDPGMEWKRYKRWP